MKWTEWNKVGQTRQNRTKWIEVDLMNQWTKVHRNVPKCSEIDQSGLNGPN